MRWFPKIGIAIMCENLKPAQEIEGDKKSPSSSEFSQFGHQKSCKSINLHKSVNLVNLYKSKFYLFIAGPRYGFAVC